MAGPCIRMHNCYPSRTGVQQQLLRKQIPPRPITQATVSIYSKNLTSRGAGTVALCRVDIGVAYWPWIWVCGYLAFISDLDFS